MATPGLTSSFELFTKSKNLVLKNLNTFGILLLLPFLLGLFSSIRSRDMNGFQRMTSGSSSFSFSANVVGVGALLGLVILFLMVMANLMVYILSLESAQDKKPGLNELWVALQKYGVRLFLLFIVVALVIFAGLIAFIVPGIIFIRRYFLAPYVMIDQDLSITDTMKESARISKPHSGSVWGIIGVTILLSIPGIIPVVGWAVSFALTSLYLVAPALRYLELKKLAPVIK